LFVRTPKAQSDNEEEYDYRVDVSFEKQQAEVAIQKQRTATLWDNKSKAI